MKHEPIRLPLRRVLDIAGSPVTEGPAYARALVFAITARCGSTALMDAMARTMGAGEIAEIFNHRWRFPKLQEDYRAESLQDFVNRYHRDRMRGDTVAFKTTYPDLIDALPGEGVAELFPRLRIVDISRMDIVAQAYSLWKARTHRIWHARSGDPTPAAVPQGLSGRDCLQILRITQILHRERESWERFFRLSGAPVLSVTHEQICADLPGVVRRIHGFAFGRLPEGEIASAYVRTGTPADAANIAEARAFIDAI